MTYKRVILISGFDATVRMRDRQLLISEGAERRGSIPLSDVGMLVIDTPLTVLTNAAMVELTNAGGAIALCDDKHLPAALILPIAGNCVHAERLRLQTGLSQPVRKRIWQKIVQAKIRNQAVEARRAGHDDEADTLDAIARKVRSGDAGNNEARAAQIYWRTWTGHGAPGFARDPNGDAPNSMLNYGYAIVRAAVARALTAAGLHPALGIFHRSRVNAFALADDVMEPFRPFIDEQVRGLYFDEKKDRLDTDAKAALLRVLISNCRCDGHASTVLNAAAHMANSVVAMMQGVATELKPPEFADDEPSEDEDDEDRP